MNGNVITKVDTYQKLLDLWPFLLEGLDATKANCEDNIPDVTNDIFFKTLLAIATNVADGVILVLQSKNYKNLGFIVLVDTTAMYEPKTVTVYIAYSNAKCPSTIHELKFEGYKWARENTFVRVRALSFRVKPMPRLSGAVRRYFSKTLGLQERCVVFETYINQ
jgi:hypothetical protein